jgi:hypothetical protein
VRKEWLGLLVSVTLTGLIISVPSPAAAFGTIDGAGQHREHERITRAALACAENTRSNGDCFEPKSMDQLAGRDKAFGAVGAPDSDEISDPAAHCDNADFLSGSYPRRREQATVQLVDCVAHLRTRFREGIDIAKDLLDGQDHIVVDEVALNTDCRYFGDARDRAKCESIEGLGRALHGAQDFYSHSNWADEADPSRPIGPDNPPGLNLPGPSPILDLRGDGSPPVPLELTTGCYVLRDRVPGVGACEQRITHAALNKDTGIIDRRTGVAIDPTTPRGLVRQNFAKAVTGAVTETRRQWRDFRLELETRYGDKRASLMICVLTHDDPVEHCRGQQARVAPLIILGVAAALVAGPLLFHLRRRRQNWPPG